MQQKAIKFNTKSFRETLKLYGLTVNEANALTGKNLHFWENHLHTGKVDRASLTLFRAKIKLLRPKTIIEDPAGAYMDCLNAHSCTPDEILLTKRLLEMLESAETVEDICGGCIRSPSFNILFSNIAVAITTLCDCPRATCGNNLEKPI